ncbi:hypothetical protein F503_08721 [Ophiostoma piceae UAMH 11346]|uniref:Uncharacterized protein n=1 Tax=Ophiostoma piceae (strain UAMH 11346) TaxID=1262450 RepID=S3BRR4_OPHP1|nr:hypothetical protein F503_08721 [Ophiostoma piceae UAMH 11346]
MKQYTPEGRCVDPEVGHNSAIYVNGCDLFLLEQWNNDSAESDNAQMMQIFERFLNMPIGKRLPWEHKLKGRGIKTAQDLTQSERDLLFRIRPVDELAADQNDFLLRTYYGPGSDEAYAELIDPEALFPMTVLNDKDLYNFGSEWQRVFSRLPQLLSMGDDSVNKLALLKDEGCRLARGLPLDDYSHWAPDAHPTPGSNMPLDEAFSMYQRFSHHGFAIVLDELALGPNWRDIDALTDEQQAAATDPHEVYDMGGGTGQRWWPPVRRHGDYWEQRKDERKMLAGWYDASGEFTRWNWLTRNEMEEQQGIVTCGMYEEHAIWLTGALDNNRLEAYVEEHKTTN